MTRSRDTSNTFIELDQLARAYAGTNAPVRDKERLADVWFVEQARTANEETKRLERVGIRSLTKRTRYYKKGRI